MFMSLLQGLFFSIFPHKQVFSEKGILRRLEPRAIRLRGRHENLPLNGSLHNCPREDGSLGQKLFCVNSSEKDIVETEIIVHTVMMLLIRIENQSCANFINKDFAKRVLLALYYTVNIHAKRFIKANAIVVHVNTLTCH